MSLKIIDGNLLDMADSGLFDMIVHGANCFCVMGAGIALQIKNKYPQAYEADLKTLKGDKQKLGHYSWAKVSDSVNLNFVVVNAYTQYGLSNNGEDVLDYQALDNVLTLIKEDFHGMRMGFPLIGCGLAHGDEKKVISSISTILKNEDVTIVRFKATNMYI